MSTGINTCASLPKVQLIIDNVWADSAKQKDYIANVDVAQGIRQNTTVHIAELENPVKDRTVTVYWPEFCGAVTQACTTDCDAGGNKPGTQCKDYALTMCREVGFSVDEKTYRSLAPTFEEAIAVSFLANMQALDEWIATQFVSKLHLNKGVNAYTGGKGVVSGFQTNVAASYWSASLLGYLSLVAKKNKFNAPFVVSGTNLYEAYWQAQQNANNADGSGAKNMFNTLPIFFDIFNVDSVMDPSLVSFLVNKNALAFHNKAYYNWGVSDEMAKKYTSAGFERVYKMESKNLPGVFYDVTYKIVCSGNEFTHSWKIKFNGDIFVNPVGCNPNNTNILEFVCA